MLYLVDPEFVKDIRIYRSPRFYRACNHVLKEMFHRQSGTILCNRLSRHVIKTGTIPIGSVAPHIFYEWLRGQNAPFTFKSRCFDQTIGGQVLKIPREYFAWGCKDIPKSPTNSGDDEPVRVLLPFLEPHDWAEVYHEPFQGRRLKSYYIWIQFIYRPFDHRLWCGYRQVSVQEYATEKWSEVP